MFFRCEKHATFSNYFFQRRMEMDGGLAEGLHEFVDGSVEVFVGSALLVDLGDRVHDRGVVLAAELTAYLG